MNNGKEEQKKKETPFFADEVSIEIDVKKTFLQMELQLALLLLAATGVLAQDEDPAAGGEEYDHHQHYNQYHHPQIN